MRLRAWTTLSIFLAVTPTTGVSAWDVAPCSAENREAWKHFNAKLRSTADPEAPIYVPLPFPETVGEAWEDFLFYHRRAFADSPVEELRPTERRFFEVVEAGRARVTGRRVVNWSASRCGQERERAHFFLLSVEDHATGLEITRVAVGESGLVHSLIHRPIDEEWQHLPRPLEDLEQVNRRAAAVLGSPAEDLQYVAATGTLRCDVLLPCVAFRQGGQTYLHHGERGLFRLDQDRGVMRLGAAGSGKTVPEATQELRARGEHLVSLHADAWLAAIPVDSDDE